MKQIVGSGRVLFGMLALVLPGCDGGRPGVLDDGEAGRIAARAVSARALSRHYVEVTFADPVGAAANDPGRYSITGPEKAPLRVRTVVEEPDPRIVVLATDPQEDAVQYELTVRGNTSGLATQEALSFPSNTSVEPFLMSAIALSNTSVLLTFSERMDTGVVPIPGYYEISNPDLSVTPTLVSGDGFSITLTTSSQAETGYTVRVTNLQSSAGKFI